MAIGCVLFVTLLGYLVSTSISRRATATFPLRTPRPGGLARPGPWDTVTVDARDPGAWRYVDLDHGSFLEPPDTAGWDVSVRRFQIRTREAAAIGEPGPPNPVGRGTTSDVGEPGTLGKWYRYNLLSHVLEPRGLVYRLRTDEARVARVEILSYYCPGLSAGCVTFRYAPATGPSSPSR